MPPRNRKPPCHNCPKAKPTPPAPPATPPTPPVEFSHGQSLKLWNHVLFGTGTCIGMIEGYTDLDMPGNPLDGIKHLRDRLNQLIKKHEDRNHAAHSTDQ